MKEKTSFELFIRSELRQIHQKLKELVPDEYMDPYRDVREYLGDNIHRDQLEIALYYKRTYYPLTNKGTLRSKINATLDTKDEISPQRFNSWVKSYAIDKLAEYGVSFEYLDRIIDHENIPTNYYITTRGDILSSSYYSHKIRRDHNEAKIFRANGLSYDTNRGLEVFASFIDADIWTHQRPARSIFYLNRDYGDCDITNLVYKDEGDKSIIDDIYGEQ